MVSPSLVSHRYSMFIHKCQEQATRLLASLPPYIRLGCASPGADLLVGPQQTRASKLLRHESILTTDNNCCNIRQLQALETWTTDCWDKEQENDRGLRAGTIGHKATAASFHQGISTKGVVLSTQNDSPSRRYHRQNRATMDCV